MGRESLLANLQVLSPSCSLQLPDDPGDEAPVVVDHVRLLLLNLHQVVEGLSLRAEDLLVDLKMKSCEVGWTVPEEERLDYLLSVFPSRDFPS